VETNHLQPIWYRTLEKIVNGLQLLLYAYVA